MKHRTPLWIIVVLLCLGNAQAQTWSPAKGPLQTPWTRDVSPDNVWPQYPRPQIVRPHWTNLNGLWDYAIVARENDRPLKWDGQILVPFAAESALSGVKKSVLPSQRLWYRRFLAKPIMERGQRLMLHFGAVDWRCTLWINGIEVGSHTGGYDPFTFDITDQVKAGDNEIVLAVWDPTDEGYQPRGKQVLRPHGIMYTAVTGIWQTVWMEVLPETYIQSIKVTPDVDNNFLRVETRLNRDEEGLEVHAEANFSVEDKGDGVTGDISGTRMPLDRELRISFPGSHQIKLWTPDRPVLHDLRIRLMRGDRELDRVTSYFGMRKIEVAPDDEGVLRLKLNGEVLFQYGPLDQGWWPDGLYTPASDEAMRYDIAMTKKFGMNMARKHVKYECARWYYWCDKMGLLVWQDMPAGDSPRNEESKANFRRELKAMIDTLHNFPSIVMWVPFNEGWGQFDTSEIVQWVQQYDPTRPVNEASGWHDRGSGDVSDMHSYPGPGMRPVEKDRVVVLGEFGGLGMPVKGHTWQDEENWGYVSYENKTELTDAYVNLLTQMRPLVGQGLAAAVYTQTSDVEIEVNGLLTYDRAEVKMDLERCADAAHRLYLPPPKVSVVVPTSQRQPQTWRYTTAKPAEDWQKPNFNDQAWLSGPGGFGSEGTPGAVVGTAWDSSDIWLRRTITLSDVPDQDGLGLIVHHDEDAEIYVNGIRVKDFKGYTTSYLYSVLSPKATEAFRSGANTIAVHCRQTRGGQFIDVGLVLIEEQSRQ